MEAVPTGEGMDTIAPQQQQLMEIGQNPGVGQQQQQQQENNGQPTEGAVTNNQPTTEVKQERAAGDETEVEPEER